MEFRLHYRGQLKANGRPLLVYLDSKDLIELEHRPAELDQLPDTLKAAGAILVLSPTHIDELIEPLTDLGSGSTGTSVTYLMNKLEEAPHCWLRTVDLEETELKAAAAAFTAGVDPALPVPFRASLLDAALVPSTIKRQYRGRPLAAIVWDLAYGQRASLLPADLSNRFPPLVAADRGLIETWSEGEYSRQLRRKFDQKITGILKGRARDPALIRHLWRHPDWCPAGRLSFEAYHMFVCDRQTVATPNDVRDFTHTMAVPYVDVFTGDRNKRDLLRKLRHVRRLANMPHWGRVRILQNLDEVLVLLGARQAGHR